MLKARNIKQVATAIGFDLCGISRSRNFDAEKELFERWLACGYHAGLMYLERNVEKRFSVESLQPGTRTVIMCGVVYKNDSSLGYDPESESATPKIASYARTADYHHTLKEMLVGLAAELQRKYGTIQFRAFTDSAPVLEKRWAQEAGLGFIGRNTLLVSPEVGSFLLLGELLIDAEVDEYDEPYSGAGCGTCRRCIESCPNGALTSHGLDARRCVSRLTIERVDPNAYEKGSCAERSTDGWVFGCDVCQSVCPYNQKAPLFVNERFRPLFDPRDVSAKEWLAMTPEEFDIRFRETPLSRSGLERIRELLLQWDE